MTLLNNTPMAASYNVTYGNAGECGSIPAGQTVTNAAWDNQASLQVVFGSIEGNPPSAGNPFWITIPSTGVGTAVTIGIYQE
jgi:hypothetical protein